MSVQTVPFRTGPDQVRLFAALRESAPRRTSYLVIRAVGEPASPSTLELRDSAETGRRRSLPLRRPAVGCPGRPMMTGLHARTP